MSKINGKLLKFYFATKVNGSKPLDDVTQTGITPVPIIDGSLDVTYADIDVTDSSNSGETKDFIVGRADRSTKINGLMLDSGSKKAVGKAMSISYNAVSYPATSLEYSVQYDKKDVTDSATTGDGTEPMLLRCTRSLKIDYWMQDSSAGMPLGTSNAFNITIATGITLSGNAIGVSKNALGSVNDAAKSTHNLKIVGDPTEALMGLPVNQAKDCLLIFATGKRVEGPAIISAKVISADVKGEVKVAYTIDWVGAPTETP